LPNPSSPELPLFEFLWSCGGQGGGEKRKLFSEKTEKPGERERENFCWKVTLSRENFSPEKILK
jgi:hypothetical protein